MDWFLDIYDHSYRPAIRCPGGLGHGTANLRAVKSGDGYGPPDPRVPRCPSGTFPPRGGPVQDHTLGTVISWATADTRMSRFPTWPEVTSKLAYQTHAVRREGVRLGFQDREHVRSAVHYT